ncbi:MAG: mRNA interferase MqsR [Lysobacteraceae bacterium]|jgi:motility quorum-sensing regulator/GCU-specific mRNA interferase toxin|nr:MAG: mRNA interferase MqsR [Xanthomonadaceae bacterium]
MEKFTPHSRLAVVGSLLRAGRIHTNSTAMASAGAMGIELKDMLAVVAALTPADFHKSMTTLADHRVWQDVYRPATKFGRLYVKLTVFDYVLIVSFKEA